MNYYKSSKKTYETDEEIKELALNYLDKYQPSKKDLRLYLFRKVLSDDQGSANKSIILEQIDKIINNLEQLGLINDDLYSEIKSKNFLKRGYSLNKIKMTLSQKGIDSELLKRTIENIKNNHEDPDFYSAIKICKRRRIGPYRPDANKEMFLKKDIGVLARAGFSYDTSMQVLNIDKQELKILEKKI
ncbi:recombination regulator RecX [Pelagibacteraceae bacterium]|jgi:regulatory protein|nr:recombination regulator RecX [Pelagibacteraceae bacterium]